MSKYDYIRNYLDLEYYNNKYSESRIKLHENIIDKYFSNNKNTKKNTKNKLIFTSGCYGSGKTHVIKLLNSNKKINLSKYIFIKYNNFELLSKTKKIIKEKLINFNKDITHKGNPLPDPINGRPKLNWCICTHSGCRKEFSYPSDLVNHLIKNNVYTKGYHLSHEESVCYNKLTPELVLTKKITKCPSWMCEIKSFNTPIDLIEHLKILGIQPFWDATSSIKPYNLL
jgi:hypothetical protein